MTFDLAIIGGGINGTGIAALAAHLGLSVILFEQDDLANHTSSASSKLIHGGLRYLEQYEFRLVREALQEREVLWHMAPHIIKPLPFILPHAPHLRPRWMIRLGLWFYDHLARNKTLPSSYSLNLQQHDVGHILKPQFTKGFCYYDCWANDARLVVLNALYAKNQGAKILPRNKVTHVRACDDHWDITTAAQTFQAKTLINATGPWVSHFLHQHHLPSQYTTYMVQGSHIILPKLYEHDHAYILQHTDGRVIFVLPFEKDFSLVGTTDTVFTGDPANVDIAEKEITYLCDVINYYFKKPITPQQIVSHYSGVRPLLDDGSKDPSKVTRDYFLDLQQVHGLPLLSIFGGKITTYRELAISALKKCHPLFEKRFSLNDLQQWHPILPGGDLPQQNPVLYQQQLQQRYPWLPTATAERYAHSYGTLCERFLEGKTSWQAMGKIYGLDLTEAEVTYLKEEEWAQTPEDILWRRTKLGLWWKPEFGAP